MDVFDDLARAAEGDRERKARAIVLRGCLLHASCLRPPEAVYILIRVSNANKTTFDESFEQRVVNWREVLVFVNEDEWKFRECSSEQCGHVYLIVVIDETVVGLLDRALEDGVDKIGGEVIWHFLAGVVEFLTVDKATGVGIDAFRDVAEGLGLCDSVDDGHVDGPEGLALVVGNG